MNRQRGGLQTAAPLNNPRAASSYPSIDRKPALNNGAGEASSGRFRLQDHALPRTSADDQESTSAPAHGAPDRERTRVSERSVCMVSPDSSEAVLVGAPVRDRWLD